MTSTTEHVLFNSLSNGTHLRITTRQGLAPGITLVRFLKTGARRKLLDQIAEWGAAGWASNRWVPRPPAVPENIIRQVEALLS